MAEYAVARCAASAAAVHDRPATSARSLLGGGHMSSGHNLRAGTGLRLRVACMCHTMQRRAPKNYGKGLSTDACSAESRAHLPDVNRWAENSVLSPGSHQGQAQPSIRHWAVERHEQLRRAASQLT